MSEKEIYRIIGKCDLIEYIDAHPEINYVVTVVTPHTYLHARAVLHFLNDNIGLSKPNGIIIVRPSQPNVWPIKSEMPLSHEHREFYGFTWMKMKLERNNRIKALLKAIVQARKNKLARRRRVYVIHIDSIWDAFAVYGKAYSDIGFEHYYLDEPEEPYYNFKERFHVVRSLIDSWYSNFRSKIWPNIRRGFILVISGISIHTLHMYDKINFFSEGYCKYIKKVLAEEGEGYNFSPSRSYVLYLSNAYDDKTSQQITDIAEEVLLIFQKKGYDIFIKQHPRECSQLNFKMISPKYVPNKYAVESLVAVAEKKPSAVIGAASTALAKIAAFWKIPCYCLLDHPLLWNKRKFEWFRGYNDCAMRGIPEFKYSRHLNEFFYKENR